MFLAVPGPALLICVKADAHDIGPGAGQDGHKAVIRPLDAEGVFHGRRQVSDNLRQTAAQGLSQQQRRPDYGDVEKQVNGELTCPGRLIQIVLTSKKYGGPKDLPLDNSSGPVLRCLLVLPSSPRVLFDWDFDPVARWLAGEYLFYLVLGLFFATDFAFSLAGADGLLTCARCASRRAAMEGRSLVPLIAPLSLGIEELIFVTCESRSDREPFFPLFS